VPKLVAIHSQALPILLCIYSIKRSPLFIMLRGDDHFVPIHIANYSNTISYFNFMQK